MLGFPVKSQSMDEVYDERAGLGDLLSLITLHHIAFEIGKVYGPGAKFRIISDYAALKDIVSPESAGIYQEDIQHLVDLFPGTLEYDRSFHDATFSYTVSDVPLEDKRYVIAGSASAGKIMVAKAKSEGFSAYITNSLKDTPHLRFSVHQYKNGESNKLTLPFMGKKLGTPWHHVCVVDAESKSVLTKYRTNEGDAIGEMKVMDLPTIDGHVIPLTYFKV
jgi:pyoverdine/dityrosine biosynthesis protein Dit1